MDDRKKYWVDTKLVLQAVGVAVAIAAAYAIGVKVAKLQEAVGIQAMWLADPTFRDHMVEVIEKVEKTM